MNRAIAYLAVTLISLAFAAIVATAASRYLSAQFERGASTFEVAR